MVFTSALRLVRYKGPDEFWRKRRIFKLASHFIGKRRNCYSVAVRYVHRALNYARVGRQVRKDDILELRDARIAAGVEQHGFTLPLFKVGLYRSNILLNRKSLSDLAIWEPYSFKALTDIAWAKVKEDKVNGVDDLTETPPDNVFTRDMLKS